MNDIFFPVADEYDGKLPYSFAGVGCFWKQEHVKRPGGRFETEWMYPYYQWIQCRSGKGEVLFSSRKFTVSEGQGMLIFPNEPHEYYALTDVWEVDWVIFSGKHLEEFIRDIIGIKSSEVFFVTMPNNILDNIVKLYKTSISDDPMKYLLCSEIVYEILMNIYIYAFQKAGSSLANKTERLRLVFDYINAHYMEPISLSVLSELISVTPQHLCTVFKSLTSRSVFEYLNSIRIQKSKELLLLDRSKQIKDIAVECGYNDVSYFCSTFKKIEGVSPTVFRQQS